MIGFPLLLVPFAIYNMIVFLTPGVDWATVPYTFPLKSGVTWGPSVGDMFIVFSLLMLMLEFIKSTRSGKSIVEHFLSLLLVGGAGAEFVMVKETGNSLFMQLVAICAVDLFAGFAASYRRARRTVVVEQPVVVAPTPAPVPPAAPIVRAEPTARTNPFAEAHPELRTEPVVKVEPAEKIP